MKAPRLAKLVMLMEDEDDIARLVTHHLNSGGFRTHCPERAAESDSRRRERSASAFHPGPYAPRSGRIPTLPQYQGTSESERYSDSDPYGKNRSRGPKTGDREWCRLVLPTPTRCGRFPDTKRSWKLLASEIPNRRLTQPEDVARGYRDLVPSGHLLAHWQYAACRRRREQS